MSKNIYYLLLSLLVVFSSCESKAEKERKQQEAARIERKRFVNDSIKDETLKAAKAYQDSVKQAKHLKKVKNSIKITSYYLTSPNSANGVSAYFYYKNLSDKVIKYLVWTGYPINAVNDIVSCEIRGSSLFSGKDTGPVKKGGTGGGYWDCAWYNYTAKKLVLEEINIEYMDGSTLCIKGDDLYLVGMKKNK